MAAKKEADGVAVIKEACMADASRIAGEKADAEADLAQAKPFLEEAERAVESIKVKLRNPGAPRGTALASMSTQASSEARRARCFLSRKEISGNDMVASTIEVPVNRWICMTRGVLATAVGLRAT